MTDSNSKKWHQALACRQNLLLNVFKFVFVSVFKFEISKTCNLCQTLPSVFFFFFYMCQNQIINYFIIPEAKTQKTCFKVP